jgi:hypothetical protein
MAPRVLWPVLLALGVLLRAGPAPAQVAPLQTIYTKHTVFSIPFTTDAAGRLKQIQLYVSRDKGVTWNQVEVISPERQSFKFTAPSDGLYWFAVRTLDLENRFYPTTMDGAHPGLIVFVDTQPPAIRLHGLPSRDGDVGVEWEVRDENLQPGSIRLEYLLPGGVSWLPLAGNLPASGQRFWSPGTNGTVEVRLHAEDRAGNAVDEKTTVNPGPFTGRNPLPAPDPGAARIPEGKIRLVNSKRIALNYKIDDKGPSGISAVELWYTQDPQARTWQKYREEDGKTAQPPFVVEVNDEGLYGFTLVVRSGAGLGDRPPQVGDKPQVWVEVDLTKPVVRIENIDVGRGSEAGLLKISWRATDKNLGPTAITLSYAEQAGGSWKPIETNLANTGRYVWKMPPEVPYQFLIRVEAVDRAGNVGGDETPRPVNVDLKQPRGVILEVEPVTR